MRLFLISNYAILLSGFVHVILHFILMYTYDVSHTTEYEAIKVLFIEFLFLKKSLSDLMKGFSITMGVFMLFYGGLNIILSKRIVEVFKNVPFIFIWNALLCFITMFISILYFHWPPVLVFGFSAIVNTWLYIKSYQ